MINPKDLQEILPVYVYPKGHTDSYDVINELVRKTAGEFCVPIDFTNENFYQVMYRVS